MKASKFFKNQLKNVIFTQISDKDGWSPSTSSKNVSCVVQETQGGYDPTKSFPFAILASATVFVPLSESSKLQGFTVGDSFTYNEVEYGITQIDSYLIDDLGAIFSDFSMKIQGVKS